MGTKNMIKKGKDKVIDSILDVGKDTVKQLINNQRAIYSLYDTDYGYNRVLKYLYKLAPEKVEKYKEYKIFTSDTITLRMNIKFIIKLSKTDAIIVSTQPIDRRIAKAQNYHHSARQIVLEFIGYNRFRNLHNLLDYIHDKNTPQIIITDSSDYDRALPPVSFDNIIMDQQAKDEIIEGLKDWIENKDEYVSKGMVHKIGILLYGKAGTGKSSIVKAIAHMFGDANIYMMDTGRKVSYSASVICSRATDATENTNKPTIVLMEDFDLFFTHNRNKRDEPRRAMADPIAMDYASQDLHDLLQFLDGNLSVDNTIIVATTTHVEDIDPDVVRYGRFDIQIELGYFDRDKALEYMNLFNYGSKELDSFNLEFPVQPAYLRYKVLEYKAKERKNKRKNGS